MIERLDSGTQTSTLGAVVAPTVGWAAGPLGAVQAAAREISRQTAVQARAVAAFAASRPASVDRAQGERGAMSPERWAGRSEVLRPVSEWATPELALALNLTQQAAEALLAESLTLAHRLPATLTALESGLVHRGHVWHLIDKVAPIADAGLRAEIEADVDAVQGVLQLDLQQADVVVHPGVRADRAAVDLRAGVLRGCVLLKLVRAAPGQRQGRAGERGGQGPAGGGGSHRASWGTVVRAGVVRATPAGHLLGLLPGGDARAEHGVEVRAWISRS